MSAPLRQLLTVRSQAAELLLAYLKGVEQTLSRTPLLERFGHRLGEETAETVPVGSETGDGVTRTKAPRSLPRVPLRVRAFDVRLDARAARDHERMRGLEREILAERSAPVLSATGEAGKMRITSAPNNIFMPIAATAVMNVNWTSPSR